MKEQRAIFLDRDGVINEFVLEAIRDPEEFRYYEFTATALRRLGKLGCPVVVVTNQSAIGRGWTTESIVGQIHQRLMADLNTWGVEVLAIKHCPHHPDDGCRCRKPDSGMLEEASREFGIDLASSIMVGDSVVDMQVADKLKMKRIRVKTGRGESPLPADLEIDAHVKDLSEAVDWIASWLKENPPSPVG
ncbi:hypothetical protein CBD41_00485 [bacterium TMED181]|mgnify:CR=1 FL=1|nr:D,D-heptose 1,7-bisphosphate phosphatase [Planctomycetota bacterium]OUW47675.1 MAG: hypothetical protein CBD41_00485 [bacterium TMED181]